MCVRYNVHEVLQMLEDTEDEFEGANITILPPDMGAGSDTDGDSGDKMIATGDHNSLSRNQLLAEACVDVRRRHEEMPKLPMRRKQIHLQHNHRSRKQKLLRMLKM